MPTVISDDLNFAFLHVPKTGGTTFGQQIAEQVSYDQRFYEGVENDPELGEFFQDHLTMPMYAKNYPTILEKLRRFDVYAIARDPFARFKSALAENARMSSLGELSQLPLKVLEGFVSSTMGKLEKGQAKELNMIFFRPQAEFLSLDGEPVARRVFDISALAAFADEMAAKYRLKIDHAENRRPTPHYDRAAFGKVAGLGQMAAKVLPEPIYDAVKSGAKRALARKSDPDFDALLDRLDVAGFVDDFYRDDFGILNTHAIRA